MMMREPFKGLRRASIGLIACVVLAGPLFAQPSYAKDDDKKTEALDKIDVNKLQHAYRCSVTSILREVHRQPPQMKDRFVVFFAERHPENYVQCTFLNDDRQIRCEGTSAVDTNDRHDNTAQKLNTLEAMGFSTGETESDFRFQRAVPDVDALYDVAGALLEALARVYDFPAGSKLAFSAPLVTKPPPVHIEGSPNCSAARSASNGGSP